MKQLESKFKDKLKKFLNEVPFCYHFTKEAMAIRGIPDLIGHIDGKFFALECKASESSKVDELQLYHIGRIIRCGGYAEIIHPTNAHAVLADLLAYCCGGVLSQSLKLLLDEYFPAAQPRKVSPRKKR
jgi:hypothetical protein